MYLKVIKSFIEQYLLQNLPLSNLNFITPLRSESVDSKLRVLFSDLVFEVGSNFGAPIYLLFEHKSYVEKDIEKQLVKYLDTFELDFLKDHPEAQAPLTMIPILFYHGLDNWNIRFDNNRLANLVFFDLSRLPDEHIKGTTILRIVLLTLKYIKSEEFVKKIDMIFELFKEIKNDPDAKEYVQTFSFYVEHAARKELRIMLDQKIKHFFSDEELESSSLIRYLEERGMEKGMEKGRKEGREEGIGIGAEKSALAAKLILTTNKTDKEIAKDTGLPVERIMELHKILRMPED